MKKNLFRLRLNKKGVSLMVGYVLLIALAVSLSLGVFFYLKLYLPSEKPDCPENVAITIDDAGCDDQGTVAYVDINLTNRGFFTVDTAFIKIGEEDRVFRTTINNIDERLASVCNQQNIGLKPDERYCKRLIYTHNTVLPSVQEVSVEPLIYIDNLPVLCSGAVVKKKVICI